MNLKCAEIRIILNERNRDSIDHVPRDVSRMKYPHLQPMEYYYFENYLK